MAGVSTKISLISGTLGGAGLLSYFMIEPTGIGLAVGAAGLTVGVLSAGMGALARRAGAHEATAKSIEPGEDSWRNLRRALGKLRYEQSVEKEGERGLEQLETSRARHRNFRRILSERFATTELTYGRYVNTGDQVYLSILDNLEQANDALLSVHAMGGSGSTQASEQEVALRARIAERFAVNDRALAELDRVSAALGEIKTARGQASTDLETAMKDLEELAGRAARYSRD